MERSRNIYIGQTGLIPTLPRGREYDKIYRPVSPDSYEETSIFSKLEAQVQFKVNKEKCKYPRCTHCIDSCPMGAIDLSGTEPIFSKSCDVCWLCWQTCPRGAIEVGDLEALEKAHTLLITLHLKLEDPFGGLFRRRKLVMIIYFAELLRLDLKLMADLPVIL